MKHPDPTPAEGCKSCARISAFYAEIRDWNFRILIVLLRVIAFLCFIPAFTCVLLAEWLSDAVNKPRD